MTAFPPPSELDVAPRRRARDLASSSGRTRSRRGLVAALAAGALLVGAGGWIAGAGLFGGTPTPSDPAVAGGASASAALSPSAAVLEPSPTPTPGPVMGGWYAGASGLGVADGAFASWLGQPVTIAGTWADQDLRAQTALSPLGAEYQAWTGALDIAIAGTVLGSGENYAAAARGAYDARWRTAAATLAARRGSLESPTFVRLFHEMNGFWYRNWAVNPGNVEHYKAAHARYVRILRERMPTVYISWSPNFRDHSGMPIERWYPGDDVVDCIAPDYYNDTQRNWTRAAWTAAADDVDQRGNPLGPEAWRRFAADRGKPLCFPETGLKPVGGVTDQPEWIKAFHAWLTTHANTASWELGDPIPAEASGKVLYSIYFNVLHDGMRGYTIHGAGANPRSAAAFRSLTWGRAPSP
ncbi:MAG: hypothetical protein JNL54_08685 [Kineosporiaceae bacterium]|nr:hypothetical protein [Kineosporiaceae bacterium]